MTNFQLNLVGSSVRDTCFCSSNLHRNSALMVVSEEGHSPEHLFSRLWPSMVARLEVASGTKTALEVPSEWGWELEC